MYSREAIEETEILNLTPLVEPEDDINRELQLLWNNDKECQKINLYLVEINEGNGKWLLRK